jgi:hypothetical protein
LNKLRRGLQRWRSMPPGERSALLQLMVALPIAGAALSVLGFARVRRIAEFRIDTAADEPRLDAQAIQSAQRYAILAETAALRGPYRATCLRQSLALCWLLRRKRLPATLRLGVRSADQPFEAHAWVELGGVPLGSAMADYKAFG